MSSDLTQQVSVACVQSSTCRNSWCSSLGF